MQTIVDNYIAVLKKYAQFEGRAGRSEFWYFALANFAIGFVIGFVAGLLSMPSLLMLSNLYFLAILVPSIAVGIRRMHDIDKSGWFILIPLYNIYLAVLEGTKGPNKYGAVATGGVSVAPEFEASIARAAGDVTTKIAAAATAATATNEPAAPTAAEGDDSVRN